MFEAAAAQHFEAACNVGGGGPRQRPRLFGMGCALDERHVLTAAHCWTAIADRCSWPVALRGDGTYRCDVAYIAEDHDIALLRAVEKIDDRTIHPINDYPRLSDKPLRLGTTIGFISRLSLQHDSQKSTMHTHLAVGTASMFVPRKDGSGANFAVSSTVMQKGFSGSAVFRPSGEIVAVLIQSLRFRADVEDRHAPLYVLPVVAPIEPVRNELDSALA